MVSSSSDEEDNSKFKEAVCSKLYDNSLYNKYGDKETQATKPILKQPSLRFVDNEEDLNFNSLKVTPTYQTHVAKHLTRLLDNKLEVGGSSTQSKDAKTANNKPSYVSNVIRPPKLKIPESASKPSPDADGVRLFLSSKNNLDSREKRKRSRKKAYFSSGSDSSSESSDESSEKYVHLSGTAVNADWILSGEATKGWAKNHRGEEIKVRSNMIIQPPLSERLRSGCGAVTNANINNNNNNGDSKEESTTTGRSHETASKSRKKHKKKHSKYRREGDDLANAFDTLVINNTASSNPESKNNNEEKRRKDLTKAEKKAKNKLRRKERRMQQQVQEMMQHVVPGLLDDDDEGIGEETKKKKKKKHRKEKSQKEKLFELEDKSKVISKKLNKKHQKVIRNVKHLTVDLSRLMMDSLDS